MLQLWLILSITVCGLLFGFILRKPVAKLPHLFRYLAVLSLLAGLAVTIFGSKEISSKMERRNWPTVDGKILRNELIGSRAMRPNVVYSYTIDSIIYTDSTDLDQPTFGSKRTRQSVANKRAMTYIPGGHVTVYYNTNSHKESTLLTNPYWGEYMKTGFGVFLALFGIVIIVGKRRNHT